MARAVGRAGFPLTVFNRTTARADLLLETTRASVATNPAELLAASDVVITMLADGAAVEAVFEGPEGLLTAARPGAVLIEMSTIGPDLVRALGERAGGRGMSVLDAPVSGSVPVAEAAALTTLVGGDRMTFDRVRPVLAAMTREQLYLGASGAGAAMKLGINGLIAATTQAVAEALVVAEASGIPPEAAYDAMASSVVGSTFVTYKRNAFLAPSDEPVAFTLELMQKDLELYVALAARLGIGLTAAPAIRDGIQRARASVGDEADLADIARALRQAAGISERSAG